MTSLQHKIARCILAGFEKHFAFFREITSGARERFERADWRGAQAASAERIQLYDKRVTEAIAKVRETFGISELDEPLWQQVKLSYIDLLQHHCRPELAETFYNSVFCHMFHRKYYNNGNIFLESNADVGDLIRRYRLGLSFYPSDGGFAVCVREILSSFYFGLPLEDLERDTRCVMTAFQQYSPLRTVAVAELRIDVLETPFFRNKAAYIIGRAVHGNEQHPFVIPLMNNERGSIYADTLLTRRDQLVIVFSFSRAYFMVNTPLPAVTVDFLRSILPTKTLAELYMSIGFQKQAKNEFYRDLLAHLANSDDRFVIAPGIPGMVMLVFTLPSFPYVFKVIKDRFAPQKDVTRHMVKERYLRVKMHDRVGRMADTLEYSDVAFPKHRFAPELLNQLRDEVASLLEWEDDIIVIKHLYIEKRMRPLNLFLGQADGDETRAAIADWGLAIKQLMAANIFPGDMLFKNFGITRHGRVIFYDYDEICYLTECNFRSVPPAMYPEDELAAEPWYSVGPHDVFPEEFLTFLTSDPAQRAVLQETHPDLLDHKYWRERQEDVAQGRFADVFPYPPELRFDPRR